MLTGILIGMLLVVCSLLIYDKYKPKEVSVEDERTEAEIEKEKEFKDHFNNMMNYNSEKAYGGKG
jgi:hypothetical protein